MLKRVFSYMREYKKYAWSGLLCIGVEVVLEITVPLLMADLIDYGVTNADGTYIIKKGLQMALCAVLALILGVGSAKFSALAGQGLGANIRKAEYEKLQLIIPELSEPPVRTLGATIPENESHIFR